MKEKVTIDDLATIAKKMVKLLKGGYTPSGVMACEYHKPFSREKLREALNIVKSIEPRLYLKQVIHSYAQDGIFCCLPLNEVLKELEETEITTSAYFFEIAEQKLNNLVGETLLGGKRIRIQ